jgi:hypothetical protein
MEEWMKCTHGNDPVKFNFCMDNITTPSPEECREINNCFEGVTLSPSREWVVEVLGTQPRYIDLGELEVIKNDGQELILKGSNFEVSVDLTVNPEAGDFKNMKVGDKINGIATHE